MDHWPLRWFSELGKLIFREIDFQVKVPVRPRVRRPHGSQLYWLCSQLSSLALSPLVICLAGVFLAPQRMCWASLSLLMALWKLSKDFSLSACLSAIVPIYIRIADCFVFGRKCPWSRFSIYTENGQVIHSEANTCIGPAALLYAWGQKTSQSCDI